MRKVAVFGKPGSGKSTLSKALASATKIRLHALDSIEFKPNGERVDRDIYEAQHDAILAGESWIMEGFGPIDAFYKRLNAADTLIYIDLPYRASYWLVTKRFLKALRGKAFGRPGDWPEGWPEGCSVFNGTLQSYKVLRICPTFWNKKFEHKLHTISHNKSLYIVKSVSELNRFIDNHVIQIQQTD